MRYRDLGETRKRQIRYGALAVAVVVVAARADLSHPSRRSHDCLRAEQRTFPRAPSRGTPVGQRLALRHRLRRLRRDRIDHAAQATSGDEVTVVNGLRRDEAVALIGDARRQAAAGNYTEAEASLAKAEKAMPRLPETQQARDDIARLKTPEGQFANHIQRARLAVDHDDSAAAEAALAEAARLKADAPEIAELRAALQAAARQEGASGGAHRRRPCPHARSDGPPRFRRGE